MGWLFAFTLLAVVVWLVLRTGAARPQVADAEARAMLQRWKAKANRLWLDNGRINLMSQPRYKWVDQFRIIRDEDLDAEDPAFLERMEKVLAEVLSDPHVEAHALQAFREIQVGSRGIDRAANQPFEQFCIAYWDALQWLLEAAIALNEVATSQSTLLTSGHNPAPGQQPRVPDGTRHSPAAAKLGGETWTCPLCGAVNEPRWRMCDTCFESRHS